MNELDLVAIETRRDLATQPVKGQAEARSRLLRVDVPALVAEVRRLREENAALRRGGSVPPEVTP